MPKTVPTRCVMLDERLNGGLQGGELAMLYGEAETGKTSLAIQCALSCADAGSKTIFVDCDDTFSTRRMSQIAGNSVSAVAPQIVLMKPKSFQQQGVVVDGLEEYVSERIGLVVVDTITGLYRSELGEDVKKTFLLNRELNRQVAHMAQLTRTHKMACLIISQVRSPISSGNGLAQPVAPRVLRFWPDTTINLRPTARHDVVKAVVLKRGHGKVDRPIFLRIGERGLEDYMR